MLGFRRIRSALLLASGIGLAMSLTGCKPLVDGASAGLNAAAEYLISTPIQQWIDDALADSEMQ